MEKDIRNITPNNKFGGKELISANGLNMYDFGARLHITYDGNRIATVRDDADAVTQAGSMDYPGGASAMAFEYDSSGSLIKDESRGIKSVEYDNFGNPVYIQIDGGYTKNVYSASGVKLKTINYTKPYSQVLPGIQVAAVEPQGIVDPGDMQLQGQETLEYHGPVIYRNGKIDMVLFPGGYATISGTTVTFHYYTQDYLGNNRAVVNGTTGLIEQTTAYYPYGAVIPDLGAGTTGQPFKFGGKELISANGLNMYDFGARLHYPAVPHFTSIDPMSEKYYWLSPYLYCANNPVNFVDKDGRDIWILDEMGKIISSQSFDQFDMIAIQNNKESGFKVWTGEYGTITGQSFIAKDTSDSYLYFTSSGDDISTGIFEFLAKNTKVEWSQIKTGDGINSELNYLSTSHEQSIENGAYSLYLSILNDAFIREDIHSHPSNNMYPSGFDDSERGDIKNARWFESKNKDVVCKIYCPSIDVYVYYSSRSKVSEFPTRGSVMLETVNITP